MSEETEYPILITIKGKGGKTGQWKVLALTEDEILTGVKKLGAVNQKIFTECTKLAKEAIKNFALAHDIHLHKDELRISLAFFNAMSVSSYTVLRSKLEYDLENR